ncbi:VQ motif-containing protein 10-like [Nymphaea colorata]|uniref:VQ motif-containing protein 10-like n=1 Tax=Nymphaea colorata TaxID=210225 RepID=UPI00129DD886|nr:VQ motif-containing protein 10-like [Nymphaea colorata]
MSSEGSERQPTQIKFILTRYVQTEEHNFKATVQNLTGKDAKVCGSSWENAEASGKAARREVPARTGGDNGGLKSENFSLEDFRWLMELPPLDG